MNLNKLSIVARTRTPWEAVDLGITLTNAWWRSLFLSWFIPATAIFVLVSLIFHQHTWVGYTVVWLLKPLLDRGPLFIASRRLFGDHADTRDLVQHLSYVYRRDWFWALTLRRFTPTRSFDSPLSVLEQLSGQNRSHRQAVLHSKVGGVASWLTIISVHVELFIVLGIGGLLAAMIPEQASIDFFEVIFDQQLFVEWIYSLCIFAAMCLIGPYYAVSGFVLYISRRIDLEAWDIEIRFRHLATEQENKRKFSQTTQSSIASLICTAVVSVLLLFPATEVSADDVIQKSETENFEATRSKDDIIDIKLGDDFHQTETVSGWRLKDFESDPEDDEIPQWLINVAEFFEENSGFLETLGDIIRTPGAYLELILWGIAAFLIVFIIYKYRKLIKTVIPTGNSVSKPDDLPDVMFGLDVRQESIPKNVASAVHALWVNQQYRDAVSLLYRSTLAGLIHYHGLEFSASDTEGECLRKVNDSAAESLQQFFSKLTGIWQSLAYGHNLPEEALVKELCEQWDEVLRHD